MIRKTYQTAIDATAEKIWQVLWEPTTYCKWTSAMSPGGRVETDWKQGSRALFLDVNGDGIFQSIEEVRPHELMVFKYLGDLKDGKEDFDSPKVEALSGARQVYRIQDRGSDHLLTVELDLNPEYEEFFDKAFPRALDHVRTLSEDDML